MKLSYCLRETAILVLCEKFLMIGFFRNWKDDVHEIVCGVFFFFLALFVVVGFYLNILSFPPLMGIATLVSPKLK